MWDKEWGSSGRAIMFNYNQIIKHFYKDQVTVTLQPGKKVITVQSSRHSLQPAVLLSQKIWESLSCDQVQSFVHGQTRHIGDH